MTDLARFLASLLTQIVIIQEVLDAKTKCKVL